MTSTATAEATGYEHIVRASGGRPMIANTGMSVAQLVEERMAYGWSPEELQFQHPHLTLGQIYSGLAYYSDHADEINRDIERRLRRFDELRREAGPSTLQARLKAACRL